MKTNILFLILVSTLFFNCKKNEAIDPVIQEVENTPESTEPGNKTPSAAVLNSPGQDQDLTSLTPLFDWEDSIDPESDAITYNLYLGLAGNTLNLINSGLTLSSYDLDTPLLKGTEYQWKVESIDSNENTVTSEILSFSTAHNMVSLISDNAAFSKRKGASLVVFNEKIWLLGGEDEAGNALAEIWSSTDAVNWNLETDNSDFGTRKNQAVIAFKNKLWMYNGSDGSFLNNEIWSSADGLNWTQETNEHPWNTTPFLGQNAVTMFVHDDKIYRFAAYHGETGDLTPERNVWSSEDGKNWSLEIENHGFDSKYGMKVVSFQNKLIGLESYFSDGQIINKVRRSTNVTNWEVLSESLPFDIGYYADAVVYNEKLYVTGGLSYNELWFTEDGLNWEKAVQERNYPIKSHNTSVVFEDKIIIVGGNFNEVSNDIWIIE